MTKTTLTLRAIGNSKGVLLPKAMLDGLNFENGIECRRTKNGLMLRPVGYDPDDPYGFGASARAQIDLGEQDPLLIPDVLPGDPVEPYDGPK